jgi:hypothetical protein
MVMTLGIRARLYGIVFIFTVGLIALAWPLLSLEFDALKTRRQQELKGLIQTAVSRGDFDQYDGFVAADRGAGGEPRADLGVDGRNPRDGEE